jgi:hypothetical protein
MIKRLLSFKWQMMVIVTVTIIFVGWLKTKNGLFAGSRVVPAIISNEYFNHVNQNVQQRSGADERIVFVEVPVSAGDSLLGVVVRQIALFKPKVIAIDFMPTDSSLERFTLDPAVDVVLGTPIVENDLILKPVNIFNQDVHYSHVMGENSITTTYDPRIQSLPDKVVELYDAGAYHRFQQRGNHNEIIRYDQDATLSILPYEQVMDTSTFMPNYFQDKIILVCTLGGGITGQPGILDNTDVHDTPVGRQFGAVILYHEIRTLLGNFIDPASTWVDNGLLLFMVLFQLIVVFMFSHMNKKLLYVIQKVAVLISILAVAMVGFIAFQYAQVFIDYQTCCLGATISGELAFWTTIK